MAPVHHAWNDQPVDVGQNFLERLAFFGRLLGELRTNCARLVVRCDAQRFDIFTEIRNPIREFMELFAEFLWRSVTERLLIFHRLCSRRAVGGAHLHMINISVPRFPQGSGYS